MNRHDFFKKLAESETKRTLPILSFPAVQKMGITVRELVLSGEQQAKAMKIVADSTDAAASVSLMDLSVEAEAFGAAVRFSDNEVPTVTGQLIADGDDAEALRVPAVGAGRTGTCIEAIRLAKQAITDRPVLAGIIGPYSLAGRLCDVTEIMYLLYDEPEAVHTVLDKATSFLIEYAKAFRDAGADGIVVAEPLAGLLSPDMAAEFSHPYVKKLIDAVQTDTFAVVYHNCGNTVVRLLDGIAALSAAAYHFGNAVDMGDVIDGMPKDCIVMGNIDPAGRFAVGTAEEMRTAVTDLLDRFGHEKNYILSSGCDIPPHASWDNIDAFFAAAREWRA